MYPQRYRFFKRPYFRSLFTRGGSVTKINKQTCYTTLLQAEHAVTSWFNRAWENKTLATLECELSQSVRQQLFWWKTQNTTCYMMISTTEHHSWTNSPYFTVLTKTRTLVSALLVAELTYHLSFVHPWSLWYLGVIPDHRFQFNIHLQNSEVPDLTLKRTSPSSLINKTRNSTSFERESRCRCLINIRLCVGVAEHQGEHH